MSEKREPDYTILLRKRGKKGTEKIELFPQYLWWKKLSHFGNKDKEPYRKYGDRYRVRHNGKWVKNKLGDTIFLTKTQIKELIFRQIGSTHIRFRKQKSTL